MSGIELDLHTAVHPSAPNVLLVSCGAWPRALGVQDATRRSVLRSVALDARIAGRNVVTEELLVAEAGSAW